MSLESFYGGKQGVSPIVKARFKYIDTNDAAYITYFNKNGINPPDSEVMERCFENPTYEDVWYGQLAIIDTDNKRNPNNGKLFRRVLNREEIEDGGTLHGEYIGQIVGPASGYPRIKFNSIENILTEVRNKWTNGEADDLIYPIDEQNTGKEKDISNAANINIKQDGGAGKIAELVATTTNNQLIPGATKDEEDNWKYEQGVHYSWVNVRSHYDEDNKAEDTYVYLGFSIPYTVLDFEFESLDWEKSFNATFLNEDSYLNGEQPFYQHWKIQIPRGIEGNSIGYIRRAKFSDFDNCETNPDGLDNRPILYKWNKIYSDWHGNKALPTNIETFEEENLKERTSILVYSFYMNYIDNNEQKTETVNCYLSKIKDIEDIVLEDNGSFKIQYSDGEETQTLNHLKWINNIKYNKNSHKFEITYNDGSNDESKPLHEIVDLKMEPTTAKNWNRFQILYADATDYIDFPGSYFKYVDGLNINEDSGEITYHMSPTNATLPSDINNYHSFGEEGFFINGVDKVYLGKNGHLYVKYSSTKSRPSPNVDHTSSPYIPYTIDEFIDADGKKWYRGGDLPDAIIPNKTDDEWNEILPEGETKESYSRQNIWAWWLDLGLAVKIQSGHLMLSGELNTIRYNAYSRKNGEGTYDFNNASVEDILNILNIPWTLEDGGFNYNPYQNGHVFEYNLSEEKRQDDDEVLGASAISDNIGQVVYWNKQGYFFDFTGNMGDQRWKHLGEWTSTDDKMQIRIQTGDMEYLPNRAAHSEGFTFINTEIPSIPPATEPPVISDIPNIWETIEG